MRLRYNLVQSPGWPSTADLQKREVNMAPLDKVMQESAALGYRNYATGLTHNLYYRKHYVEGRDEVNSIWEATCLFIADDSREFTRHSKSMNA